MNAAAARPRPFPWSDVMGFAFGVLRLSPDAFWSMTPRELNCALEALCGGGAGAPARNDLDRLMERFPDRDLT
ncbi:rcc01693 family protein [Nitratireductor sp.]|uniref:rcc01693 family protein n=1 Tax=Nitratireductor sp. TaxID=1872084 RepID=UPI002637475C|nr:rcc01693 family protein [Nitratireductor sp.]MCV0348791.1 phage tail assembly chaperone [Nitratireductor sp.]MCV0379194.1 phage tail assembly chaperone [Nitratireductor sp.]